VKNTVTTRLLLGAIALLGACAITGSADAAWNQYRGDGGRSGRVWWPGGATRASVAWRREIGMWDGTGEPPMYSSSPVVGSSGVVYVGAGRATEFGAGGRTPHLYAFSSSGQDLWHTALLGYGVYGAPAVGPNGRMLVMGEKFKETDDGPARPLQRPFVISESGRILGSVAKLYEGRSSPLVDADGNFYYRDPGGLWMLPVDGQDGRWSLTPERFAEYLPDLTSGSSVWDFFKSFATLGPNCSWWPGPHCDFDTSSYLGGNDYGIAPLPAPALAGRCEDIAFSPWDRFWRVGRRQLLSKLDLDLLGTPVIGRGGTVAYVTLKDSKMAALSQDGHVLWRWGWGYQPVYIAVGHGPGGSSTTTECRYTQNGRHVVYRNHIADRLYVVTEDGSLHAIDGDTGRRVLWTTHPRLVGEPIVLATREGEQVVAAGKSRLYGFRGSDGQQLWSVLLDGPARGSPAVADGHIYVATFRSLYAIALR